MRNWFCARFAWVRRPDRAVRIAASPMPSTRRGIISSRCAAYRAAMRAGLAELADKRETISHLQGTIHKTSAQIAALQTAQEKELKLLPPAQINDRLSALSSLASDQGLQVEAIEPGEANGSVRY